jgi:HEAT repeat protein
MATDTKAGIEFRRALAARVAIVRTIGTLSTMLSSPQYDVRIEALEALSDCRFDLDIESIMRKAIHDRNELVRVTAIEIAGDHKLKSIQDEITGRLTSDRSWLVRSAAAVALGDMSVLGARKILEDRIGLAGEEERVGLYYALVKLGVRRFLAPLLQGLGNDFYRIRCATANLMPRLVDKRNKRLFIRRLREALDHEETLAARSSLESTLKELCNGLKVPRP